MKVILINGQGGTGKTSVAKALSGKIKNSAFIDADSLVSVNPFEFEKLTGLLHENALGLISNFTKAGYQTIVTAGLTRNQEQLDSFVLNFTEKTEIIFVWLRANKEVRMERKTGRGRDASDTTEWFEFGERIYPDVKNFEMKRGKYIEIDTSVKKVEEVVAEIENEI